MKITIKIQYLRNQITIQILPKQKFIKEAKKNFQDDQLNSLLGFTIENDIYLNESELKFGIIIHEIVHAVNFIMTHHYIQDEESRAYLTEYIFQEFHKFCKKKKLTIN